MCYETQKRKFQVSSCLIAPDPLTEIFFQIFSDLVKSFPVYCIINCFQQCMRIPVAQCTRQHLVWPISFTLPLSQSTSHLQRPLNATVGNFESFIYVKELFHLDMKKLSSPTINGASRVLGASNLLDF